MCCILALTAVVASGRAVPADSGYARVVAQDGKVLRERRALRAWMDSRPRARAERDVLVDSLSSHIHSGHRQVITDFLDARDRIDVPASPLLDCRDAFSYSMWLWLETDAMVPQTKIVSHAGVAAGKVTLMGEGRRVVLLLRYDDGSELMIRTVERMPAGRWVHVGVAFARAVPSVILDGKRAALRVIGGAPAGRALASLPDQALHLGGLDRSFPGRIDDVRIYARALSPDEFVALAAGREVSARGLVAHWPLDDPPGGTARDVSGSGLDGRVGEWVATRLPGRHGTAMGFAREASAWTARLRDLERRIDLIDVQARTGVASKSTATVDALCETLARRNAVLVHYQACAGRPDTLTAWVAGAKGGTTAVPVAIVLDEAWHAARDSFVDELAHGRARGSDEARVRRLSREVAAPLWDPVEDALGDAVEVWLRLTPALRAVPFSALAGRDGRYLVERFAFARCGPVADLPERLRQPRRTPGSAVIIANPDFHALGDRLTPRPPGAQGFDDRFGTGGDTPCTLRGAALLGTEREAALVADLLLRAGTQVQVLEWNRAQERLLDEVVAGCGVVHVATHGYRVDDGCLSAAPGDPLFTSGVVLAGAMRHVPDGYRGGDDGLLSAAEVAGLDLDAARMVVWSACATATGEPLAGEPLCGLAAGAWIAGAGASVATLWRVSDQAMPGRLAVFYAQFLAGESPARALRATLREAMDSTRRDRGHTHPGYWAALVVEGL